MMAIGFRERKRLVCTKKVASQIFERVLLRLFPSFLSPPLLSLRFPQLYVWPSTLSQ